MKISTSFIVAALAMWSVSTPIVADSSPEQMPLELSSPTVGTSGSLLQDDDGAIMNTESPYLETSGKGNSFMEETRVDPLKDTETESFEESAPRATEQETSTVQTTSDGTFTDEQKAIWIDRHNYFRAQGLPWAAGNMKRINWDDSLAQDAATAATSCAAKTSPGLNVFEDTSTDPATVLEDAITAWIVEPAIEGIKNVVPPAKQGDSVGAGLYNSYTQTIWSSTTGVGCALAKCSGNTVVACAYSPPGNDGKSPWFLHAPQATNCPPGTTAQYGLCAIKGDSKNDLLAPIPDGLWTHQVYPTFVVDIMKAILKAAKTRDAPGAARMVQFSPLDSLDTDKDDEEDGPLQLGSCAGSTKASLAVDWDVEDLTSEEDPGIVKPSAASGLGFEHPEVPPSIEATEQRDEVKLLSQAQTNGLALSASDSTSATDSGMAPAGIASIVALGVAAVAAFAAFVSYRKKHQQQEDYLHDRVEVI